MTHTTDAAFPDRQPPSATGGPHGLRVTIHRDGRTVTMRLDGELDMATVELLRDHIRYVLRHDAPHRILLDLTRLNFTDSAGLNLMVWVNKQLKRRGPRHRLQLHNPQAQVRRVLHATGLDTQFDIGAAARTTAPGMSDAGPESREGRAAQ